MLPPRKSNGQEMQWYESMCGTLVKEATVLPIEIGAAVVPEKEAELEFYPGTVLLSEACTHLSLIHI